MPWFRFLSNQMPKSVSLLITVTLVVGGGWGGSGRGEGVRASVCALEGDAIQPGAGTLLSLVLSSTPGLYTLCAWTTSHLTCYNQDISMS